VSGRDHAFRDGIRVRDGKSDITGVVNIRVPMWTGFESVHVFLLEKESLLIQFNYGRWISDMGDDTNRFLKNNSLHSGFLLSAVVYQQFDQYLLLVNLDVCLLSHWTFLRADY